MQFGVLGPLSVYRGGVLHDSLAPKLQRLLALLLCDPGAPVHPEAIAEALWEGNPPPSARKTVQIYAHRLRRIVGAQRLRRGPGGYVLEVGPEELDALLFVQLAEQAKAAQLAGDLATAEALFGEALVLWRGEQAFADVCDLPAVSAERSRLEELRLNAIEGREAIGLELGHHRERTAELAAIVGRYPYREGLRAQLMLALYRSGRQAEALEVYRQGRQLLADELGIDPDPQLQRLHQQMLRNDPLLDAPSAQPTGGGRRFLPHGPADFVGRQDYLRWLDAKSANATPVLVTAIAGIGGVGKTALALHWAHREHGRFPDGQLYVNLRGYDPGPPMRVMDALGHLLRCLGLSPQDLPVTLDDTVARYRAVLADKRVLVVLDNANTAEQVRPLLPSSPGSLALITSRDKLSGLIAREGAVRLTLDLMSPEESRELLRRIVGDARIDEDAAAADRLLVLCGGLPLALRIAAAQLTDRPDLRLADYVAKLTREGPVTGLALEGDETYAVRAILDGSYEALPIEAQRVFRLFAAAPGSDLSAESIAALTQRAVSEVLTTLDILTGAHLVYAEAGRYSLHDLVREYVELRARQDPQEVDAAWRSLAGYQMRASKLALSFMVGGKPYEPEPGLTPQITSAGSAVAWLEAEQGNLSASVVAATAAGDRELMREVAQPLWRYFFFAGRVGDWAATFESALEAAQHLGERHPIRVDILSLLGSAYAVGGRHDLAVAVLTDCVEARQALGDRDGETKARINLAISYERQGLYPEAMVQMESALASCQHSEDRTLEMLLLGGNMPVALNKMGEHARARDCLLKGVALADQVGSEFEILRAKQNLGDTYVLLGQPEVALPLLQESMELAQKIGNARTVAIAMATIADALRGLGDFKAAVEMAERAYDSIRVMGHQTTECELLNALACNQLAAGQIEEARRSYETAQELAVATGSAHERARALVGLARLTGASDPETAKEHLTEALPLLAASPKEAEEARRLLAALTDHRSAS
ncbi:SARP family transcriptional regulator [Rhizocola hellebori]|uniref:SARP family transcriptional regulator n=1 Tax=Rhizocola hellebori TaxID=1392758 RepID=A0A8J3Q6Z1_9ACTN|nr:SARP family transcriptional regulator [Rhizocola hellebori]